MLDDAGGANRLEAEDRDRQPAQVGRLALVDLDVVGQARQPVGARELADERIGLDGEVVGACGSGETMPAYVSTVADPPSAAVRTTEISFTSTSPPFVVRPIPYEHAVKTTTRSGAVTHANSGGRRGAGRSS